MACRLNPINPASIYIVFRASRMGQIKARCAGKGRSLGKRRKAQRILLSPLARIPADNTELAHS